MPRRLRRTAVAIVLCLVAVVASGCSLLDRAPQATASDERLASLMSEVINPVQPGVSMGLAPLPSAINQAYALLGLSVLGADVPADLKSRTLADLGRSYDPKSGLFATGPDLDDHLELTSLVLALAHSWPDAAPQLLPQERIPVLRHALQQTAATTDVLADRTAASDSLALLDAVAADPKAASQPVCDRLGADAKAGAASPALLGAAVRAGCRQADPVSAAPVSEAWPAAGSVLTRFDWPDFDRLLLSVSAARACPSCQSVTKTVNAEVERTGQRTAPLLPVVETGSLYRTALLARSTAGSPQKWVEPALMRQLEWRGRLIEDVQTDPVLLAWALRTMEAGSSGLPAGVLDRLRVAVRNQGGSDGPYGPVIRAIASGASRGDVARLVAGSGPASQAGNSRALARLAAGVVYADSCAPEMSRTLLDTARSAGLSLPPQASADPVSRYYAVLVWQALAVCKVAVPGAKSAGAEYTGTVRKAMAETVASPGQWQTWSVLWFGAETECAMVGRSSLDRKKVMAAFDAATHGDVHEQYDVAAAYAMARVAQIARSGCGHAWWEPL